MKLLINKAHYPVTVLGPGRRIAIWVQGCSIRCKGCCSKDTWDADPDKAWSIDALVNWCKEVSAGQLDGITITGGEPFDQPRPLKLLLKQFRQWQESESGVFDVLLYSGFPRRRLERKFPAHLELVDAYIPEPFVGGRVADQGLYGSTNQSVVLVARSKVIQERYSAWQCKGRPKQFQVEADDRHIWFIGIPRKNDLARLERECNDRGLVLDKVSWRC